MEAEAWYKDKKIPWHVLLDDHSRRCANHDGATFPFRSVVLLFPPGRSGSGDAFAAAHRKAHQLCLRARKAERELQRYGSSVHRSRASAAYPVDWLFVWHHQRTQVGGGAAHASGVALVYRPGVRSGDTAPLHVLEEPARSFSGVEAVRATLSRDRRSLSGSRTGKRR